jgi:hypothetical protein
MIKEMIEARAEKTIEVAKMTTILEADTTIKIKVTVLMITSLLATQQSNRTLKRTSLTKISTKTRKVITISLKKTTEDMMKVMSTL